MGPDIGQKSFNIQFRLQSSIAQAKALILATRLYVP